LKYINLVSLDTVQSRNDHVISKELAETPDKPVAVSACDQQYTKHSELLLAKR